MKVLLVIPSGPNNNFEKANYSGVDYHRLLTPHNYLANDIEISQINSIEDVTVEFFSQFDLVVVNRYISRGGDSQAIMTRIKQSGAKLVIDIDDDYRIPQWHILYQNYTKEKHAERIFFGLMHADAITTTHYKIADVIRSETGNRNIYVVPNGINPEHDQFANKPTQNKHVTFGWSGSITHFEDVMLMHDSLYSLYKSEFNTRFNFVYGGHEKKDTFSNQILSVLSCKGIAADNIFATYPATDVFNYANFYDLIDVSLIPLRDNRFNNLKSNLKLIESGFKKKAAIVSDVEPYSDMLTNANCLKVQNKKGWYSQMTKLIKNRSMVEDLANQLYEDVQQYHIKVVANKRLEAYNDILK